jgi:capsular polysaccharide biosynthesis protein
LVEIDEIAARVVRQYWALVLVCIALPLVAMALVTAKQPAQYAANARIITGYVVPASSSQADAIVSQVSGIATSRVTASQALNTAGAHRSLTDFIGNHISVSGLGSSQVVDLTVTDRDRHVAQKAANVLANDATTALNNVGESGLLAALKAIDSQVVELTQKRASLGQQLANNPHSQQLQAKLAGLDEVIANLTGDRGRLLAQASTQGRAAVLDPAALPPHPQSKALPQKLGLAGLLGLVVGILIAAIVETARPTVPGARRVGRRLGAPLLGGLNHGDLRGERTASLDYLGLRLRLAAKHAGVSAVALASVGAGRELDDLSDLAASLERSMSHGLASAGAGAGGDLHSLDGLSGLGGPAVSAANSHDVQLGPEKVTAGITRAGTLVRNHQGTAKQSAPLHVYPLGQSDPAADAGRVGLVVFVGPVARVSDVAALADLVASSGWPLLGVVGVPRGRRRQASRQRSAAGSPAAGPADSMQPKRGAEENGQ